MILAPEVESKFMQRASIYLSVSIIRTRSKQLLNTSHVAGRSPPAFHMHHVILAMTLCLRYDYVTDGETMVLRIQLLGQGYIAIKQQDLGLDPHSLASAAYP